MDSDDSDVPPACPTCGGDVRDDSVHYEWRCLDCGTVCRETADAGTGPWGGPTTAHRIEPGERPPDTRNTRWYHALGVCAAVLAVVVIFAVSMVALLITLSTGSLPGDAAADSPDVDVSSAVELFTTLLTDPFMWVGLTLVSLFVVPVVLWYNRRLRQGVLASADG